jgi:hypothetical protein
MSKVSPFLGSTLLVAAAATASSAALFACLDGYRVAQDEADAASGVDASPAGPGEGGGPTDSGADSAPARDAEAGPPGTFCDGVVAPPGVTDFFCADFDAPLLAKGWDDKTTTNGGTLDKTTAVAVSQPSALVATAFGTGSEGTLTWKKAGAKKFLEATAVLQINPSVLGGVAPPSQGTLELVHITTTNASVTFGVSRGSTSIDGNPYVGFYITTAAFGGAAALKNAVVSTALAANTWTDVKLVWASTGKVDLFYNGISVFSDSGFGSQDTSVSFRVGARARGDLGAMPAHRFDDVQLGVRR